MKKIYLTPNMRVIDLDINDTLMLTMSTDTNEEANKDGEGNIESLSRETTSGTNLWDSEW